ncbi:MAG TPA: hypothetical protein IGS53_18840 [Leptolyngbyaceae cyanobacterium M33_DOE_097]|uniref:Tetratricopeptide repeat protein n=1 Tax=Oscillatoriales cyanobacterium SpSt-418 TaxID=2282169 RepID=A0A7C3PJ99_9CYAN|nr:hypothetical protein [Leptolyngbyaceae cyanobacterium M33_DOE_097]
MNNQSKEALLQEAQQLWDVLDSMRDDFEEGTGDFEARVYDVLDYLDAALNLDQNFDSALALKVELMTNELGAYEDAVEEAERLTQIAPNNPQYQAMLTAIQSKL